MLIQTPEKGNYHMKQWIDHRIELMTADTSNVIIFPVERRQTEIEEERRIQRVMHEKMRGDAPLIARSSDHLSKNSAFPPESDGKPPKRA